MPGFSFFVFDLWPKKLIKIALLYWISNSKVPSTFVVAPLKDVVSCKVAPLRGVFSELKTIPLTSTLFLLKVLSKIASLEKRILL